MKKITLFCFLLLTFTIATTSFAQVKQEAFSGAKATLKNYKALYVLNSGDEKKISGTLKNIRNVLEDPRLKGKLELELIVFGDGVAVYEKTGPFEERLKDLHSKGVILAQCENTIKERKINKNSLLSFISYVPTANGEIIIRQYQGWATVHP